MLILMKTLISMILKIIIIDVRMGLLLLLMMMMMMMMAMMTTMMILIIMTEMIKIMVFPAEIKLMINIGLNLSDHE